MILNYAMKIENYKSSNKMETTNALNMDVGVLAVFDDVYRKELQIKNDEKERLKVTVTPEYSIYTDGTSVVVKGRGNNFFWKEYFSYADNIVDAYFSDMAKRKVEKEETGYLYLDLGDLGEWWFDPFGNVDGEMNIEPQFIPNELINVCSLTDRKFTAVILHIYQHKSMLSVP